MIPLVRNALPSCIHEDEINVIDAAALRPRRTWSQTSQSDGSIHTPAQP